MTRSRRRIIGNITLSLDGRTTGPGGADDMSWVWPHNVTDQTRDALVEMTSGTAAIFGRLNYEGFAAYWRPLLTDRSAEPRFRTFAQWLETVEKVVLSTTVVEPAWPNSRLVASGAADAARSLRAHGDGDVWVLNSASVIRQLLEADELDAMVINLAPQLVGAGQTLFPDGLRPSSWTLSRSVPSSSGAIRLYYDRSR